MTSASDLIITVVFGVIMFAYWMGAFFILYHLIRFGIGTLPKRIAAIFLGGSIFLTIISILLFNEARIAGLPGLTSTSTSMMTYFQ